MGREHSACITGHAIAHRLIESDPMLHSIAKFLETQRYIVPKMAPACAHSIRIEGIEDNYIKLKTLFVTAKIINVYN